MNRDEVIYLINQERKFQNEKWGSGRALTARTWAAILFEEAGEVAKATLEHDEDNLKDEIIQVAAVCVAWLEDFDRMLPERNY